IVASRKPRRIAMEITAAGIDVENVRPALRPKYTLAAVNTSVMTAPMIRPRTVSSARVLSRICWLAFTLVNKSPRSSARRRERRIVRNRVKGQDACADIRMPALSGSEHLHGRALDALRNSLLRAFFADNGDAQVPDFIVDLAKCGF